MSVIGHDIYKHRRHQYNAQSDTQDDEHPIDILGIGLRVFVDIDQKILAEKEIKCRNGGTGQKEVFGDIEEIGFRQAYQRPMTEEED